MFPPNNDIQSDYGGNQDAFLARLNTAATTNQNQTGSWATYFGGSGLDEGTGVALDAQPRAVYLAGDTNSVDLTVKNPLDTGTVNSVGYDAFVAQVQSAASLGISGTLLGTNQTYISAGNQAQFSYIADEFWSGSR